MTMPTVDGVKRAIASTTAAVNKVAALAKAGAALAEQQRQAAVPKAPGAAEVA